MTCLFCSIHLYPQPYRLFAAIVFILIWVIIALPPYQIYKYIIPKITERTRAIFYKDLKVIGTFIIVPIFTGLTGTMITQSQVNKKLGFNYATPETSEGELFIVTRITLSGEMEQAGLKPDDVILLDGSPKLYKLLIDNQGREVQFNVLRDSKEITITVNVPEMHLPLRKLSFYF